MPARNNAAKIMDSESDNNLESAWDAEWELRAEEIRNGTAKGDAAEKVFTEVRAKYSSE